MPVAVHVDTCALLDIVRVPMRSRAPRRELEGVFNVLKAAREDRALIQLSDVVPAEFAEHELEVVQEVQRHIRALNEKSALVGECARSLNLGDVEWRVDENQVTAALLDVAKEVLGAATVHAATDQDKLSAMDRQVKSLRPGRRGKDCIMDCTITATMLRCAREQGGRSVFLSSNVRDYSADEKTARLHEDLQPAFEELDISFATTWELTARLVKGPLDRR